MSWGGRTRSYHSSDVLYSSPFETAWRPGVRVATCCPVMTPNETEYHFPGATGCVTEVTKEGALVRMDAGKKLVRMNLSDLTPQPPLVPRQEVKVLTGVAKLVGSENLRNVPKGAVGQVASYDADRDVYIVKISSIGLRGEVPAVKVQPLLPLRHLPCLSPASTSESPVGSPLPSPIPSPRAAASPSSSMITTGSQRTARSSSPSRTRGLSQRTALSQSCGRGTPRQQILLVKSIEIDSPLLPAAEAGLDSAHPQKRSALRERQGMREPRAEKEPTSAPALPCAAADPALPLEADGDLPKTKPSRASSGFFPPTLSAALCYVARPLQSLLLPSTAALDAAERKRCEGTH